MVKFDADTHTYSKNGDVYTSVTQLLQKYGLSADYSGIPAKVLKAAAERGKKIHSDLELYVQGILTPPGKNTPVDMFHRYVQTQGIDLKTSKSEEIHYNTKYKVAGTVDFQYFNSDGNLVIADFKTTSQLHIDAIAWQLSVYNYLICNGNVMQYYFNRLQVFHIRKNKFVAKEIYMIDFDVVEALLQANLNGDPVFDYKPDNTVIISDSDTQLLTTILREEENINEYLKTLKTRKDEILNKVKENLLRENRYRVTSEDIDLLYVAPHQRRSLDTKLVVDYLTKAGEDVENYYKKTTIKDNVKVTLLKRKD